MITKAAQTARWAHIKDWPPGQRLCYTCNNMKMFAEFGKNVNSSLGYDSVCKTCRKIKSRKDLEQQSQEYKIFHRAKTRAKREGISFNLELSDIVIPSVCPVFNVPFVVGNTHWTPSIDKIVPTLGYVKGNVCIICNRANRLKNDATLAELQSVVRYVVSQQK